MSQASPRFKGEQEWSSGIEHCSAPLQSVEGYKVAAGFDHASCGGRPGRLHHLYSLPNPLAALLTGYAIAGPIPGGSAERFAGWVALTVKDADGTRAQEPAVVLQEALTASSSLPIRTLSWGELIALPRLLLLARCGPQVVESELRALQSEGHRMSCC